MTIHRAKVAQWELVGKSMDAPLEVLQPDSNDAGIPVLSGFSLARYVDFALTNRPSVVSARLAVDDARLQLRQLSADAPVLTGDGLNFSALDIGASGGYHASSDSTRHLGNLSSTTRGNWSGALSVDLLLWDAGRNDARVMAQAERTLALEKELVSAGYAVFGEVVNSYFSVLERSALLEVALTNEFVFAEHLRQAEELFAAGEARNLDVLRARLDHAKAVEATVAASNKVRTAGAEFMNALGIEASSARADAVLPRLPASLAEVVRNFSDTTFSASEAFAIASTNSPGMRLCRARLRAASADVDYAIADLMPTLSASASLNWADPLWAWNWGASAVQSIFRGFRKTTAVERAVIAMQRSATEVDAAEHELSLSLALAVAERDNSVLALATVRDSLARAKENLDIVVQQYRIGEASRIDFTDAVSDYVIELGNRISVFYRGQRAEAAMFALMGLAPGYVEEIISEDKR